MASRQINMPAKTDRLENEIDPERTSQGKRREIGRYLLQVDRQTKASYQTSDDAQEAGRKIKTGYPAVQVSVYDRVDYVNTILQATPPSQ